MKIRNNITILINEYWCINIFIDFEFEFKMCSVPRINTNKKHNVVVLNLSGGYEGPAPPPHVSASKFLRLCFFVSRRLSL